MVHTIGYGFIGIGNAKGAGQIDFEIQGAARLVMSAQRQRIVAEGRIGLNGRQ